CAACHDIGFRLKGIQMTDVVSTPQSEYIQHHLVHLNNIGEKQAIIANFDVINYDSLFWSLLMGLVVVYFLWRAARSTTTGVPGRFQMAVEMLAGMVQEESKSIIPSEETRKFAAP